MANVKMEAVDSFNATSIQAGTLRPGDKFATDADHAEELEERKLAKRAKAKK